MGADSFAGLDSPDEVLARYYLSRGRLELVSLATAGFNSLWLVEGERGPYVLKQARNEATDVWVDFANASLMRLRRVKLAQLLIPTDDDGTVVKRVANCAWSLAIRSRGSATSTPAFDQIDQAVEFLHRLQSIEAEPSFAERRSGDVYDWAENCEVLLEFIRSVAVRHSEFISASALVRLDALVQANIAQRLRSIGNLPRALSHGEFQTQNVLTSRGGVFDVVDWDSLAVRPRLYDICSGLLFFCRMERGGFRLDKDVAREFLRNFALDDEESELLPIMTLIVLLPRAYLYDNFKRHNPDSLAWYVPWAINGALEAYEEVQLVC